MSEAKQVMSWEELKQQHNPFLFYAERMGDLTGGNGWHGKAKCSIPKAPEDMCRLAGSHGDCLTSDAHVALRTLATLVEGYIAHKRPTYENDAMLALAGVGTLVRLLTDALEVGRDLKSHAADGLHSHSAIQAAEAST